MLLSGPNIKLNSLLVLFCMFLCSCSDSSRQDEKEIFNLNFSSGNLESLDPAYAKDLYMMWTAKMVYNTLVETGEDLRLSPSLAKTWQVSPDGLTYTFYLRNDIFFHDDPEFAGGKGRKMIAADVVYSFNRIIDPKVASYGAWIFNDRVRDVQPFEAPDDTTLIIHLKKPFRPLPEILTMPYCSVVPHEVAERWGKDFRSHPCGTGPFQFRYWDEGNMLVLHKNPAYWEKDNTNTPLPYLDAIRISFVDSKATEFFLFLQGKLDFVNNVDGSFKDLVLTKNGDLKKEYEQKIQLDKNTYLNTDYVGFLTDTTNPLLKGHTISNVFVRQAINYAIDRKKIVTYFRNGIGLPAESGFIPPGLPGHDTVHTYGYHYDPAKSLALLQKAGYPNGKGLMPITILTPDNYADITNFVATQLKDVGIPVQVEIMQPNIIKQQMSKSQAIAFRAMWIADYPDAETYLVFFNSHLPAPPNYTRFNNPTFDRWYDESMNAPDSIRWALYRKMDSLAMSQAPLVPLFYDQYIHFLQKKVMGLSTTPMNVIDLKKVRFK